MDPHRVLLHSLYLLVLLAANALFAAAELSLAAVRRARVEQLVRERRWGARALLRALDAPERLTAGAQLGRALATVALGLGVEAAVQATLAGVAAGLGADSWLGSLLASGMAAHGVALLLALVLVASLQVVLAQQLPAIVSEQHTEAVALAAVPPTAAFAALAAPLAGLLAWLTAGLTRVLGLGPAAVHALAATPEEIQVLVERSEEGGEIEPAEGQLLKRVFEFGDLVAREVMTPRRDVVALPVEAS
ncbi:MAG TPA: CNNM domain-containing protein, partial [Longimicrobiales bacterium]